ncbi:MAG: hypothetical protein KGL39_31495, partial [Patescibacteria group bacterium]|nr:hypothetical protein [Patescibacteria group bacterium]
MRRLASALTLVAVLLVYASAAIAGNVWCVSKYTAIAATDTTVALGRYCRILQIWPDSGGGDIYVELNNNAASVQGSTCIHIAAGGTYQTPPGANWGGNSFHAI